MTSRLQQSNLNRSGSVPKKLVIKELKGKKFEHGPFVNLPFQTKMCRITAKPTLPENFEQDTWNMLQKSIHSIYSNSSVTYSLEELYRGVEDLCQHQMAASLYTKLVGECESHVQKLVNKLLNQTSDPVGFLSLVNSVWQEYCQQTVRKANSSLKFFRHPKFKKM